MLEQRPDRRANQSFENPQARDVRTRGRRTHTRPDVAGTAAFPARALRQSQPRWLPTLAHPLEGARVLGADRVVVGDDEAEGGSDVVRDALVGAELKGHLEGEGLAGLTLGGGLGAVGSHFGEPFSWRPGPLAHRQRVPLGAAQKSPARAA